MEKKAVNLKELIATYRWSKLYGETVSPSSLNFARQIADYIVRCQDFDPTIIDMIVDRSSGPV